MIRTVGSIFHSKWIIYNSNNNRTAFYRKFALFSNFSSKNKSIYSITFYLCGKLAAKMEEIWLWQKYSIDPIQSSHSRRRKKKSIADSLRTTCCCEWCRWRLKTGDWHNRFNTTTKQRNHQHRWKFIWSQDVWINVWWTGFVTRWKRITANQ